MGAMWEMTLGVVHMEKWGSLLVGGTGTVAVGHTKWEWDDGHTSKVVVDQGGGAL